MDCKEDNFGHKYMAGAGKYLENLVSEKIGCKVRSVELNVLQRSAGHILSKIDIDLAFEIGKKASIAAANGITGKMMTFNRVCDEPYECEIGTCEVGTVANKEKTFPSQWINKDGNDILPDAVKYLAPLIEGEISYPTENGLPVHFVF